MPKLTALHERYAELQRRTTRLSSEEKLSLLYFAIEEEQQAAIRTASSRPLRAISWIRAVLAVDAFVQENRRIPVRNSRAARMASNSVEQALADWLRYQRRPRTRDLHCEYQRLRLESIEGFDWSPLDSARELKAAEFQAFVDFMGRRPRHRSSDPRERSLAAFSARQTQAHRRE
ncbi:hypothetical protein GCM10007382_23450 [Salinibacterium xinjiangense]|uniref:Uncharacterized protein n=1 Tax=Salinibacterium xinjiangense TaxID=386302 RepID=A0A2C8ZVM5_9MICO|nr:hypothetical protein [Salinibacterium xinjiangense]GGL02869.1 hypothetical protein GCM10007382_23450 [Salinibacterium xinjiangense]SOE69873.1 hypothetical protein SAMN06296378_2080 [Salinibacterium xinjiangense]